MGGIETRKELTRAGTEGLGVMLILSQGKMTYNGARRPLPIPAGRGHPELREQ